MYASIQNADAVQQFLVSRATVNWVNEEDGGDTCLHRACILGVRTYVRVVQGGAVGWAAVGMYAS